MLTALKAVTHGGAVTATGLFATVAAVAPQLTGRALAAACASAAIAYVTNRPA